MTGEKRFEALAHNGPHPRLTTRTMSLDWTGDLGRVDWEELSALYRAAPLGDKPAEVLRQAFSNSMFRCFAYDGGRLVGAGRALADGVDCAYLCEHRGPAEPRRAPGSASRSSRACSSSRAATRRSCLYAVPGKEAFYMRFGFLRMRTAMAIFANQAQQLERGYLDPG